MGVEHGARDVDSNRDSSHTSSTTGVIAISASSRQAEHHEHVVAARRRHARTGVALEQRQVAQVRLPADVDEIAEDRHQPDQHVEAGVEDHARLDDGGSRSRTACSRSSAAKTGVEMSPRPGISPTIGSRPKRMLRAGDAERAVEQHRPAAQRVERDRIGSEALKPRPIILTRMAGSTPRRCDANRCHPGARRGTNVCCADHTFASLAWLPVSARRDLGRRRRQLRAVLRARHPRRALPVRLASTPRSSR